MKYFWRKIATHGARVDQDRTNPGMVERVSADSTRGSEKHGIVDAINQATSAVDTIEK